MASLDFRVKNGLVTGANNTTLGTAVTVLIGGNVGIGDTNPSYKLAVTGTLNTTGAMTQAGNQVLHAANYNSYTPTLTGTGASGTWGISISGTANSVIGNIRGTINGDITWTGGANILIAGESSFDVSGSGAFSIYEGSTASNWLNCVNGGNLNLVQNGKNVIVYGSRLYNDSSQQYVYQNSGNWAINAFNISQYPLNQSVLTTASPTFAGLTTTGNLVVAAGDLYSYRAGGATGVLFLNSAGSRYLYWDNSTYQMPGAELNVNGNRVLNAGNYNNYAVARVSTARNGVYKLFRNDSDSDYNVQTTWGGDRSGYWSLRGYSGDTYHAGCFVAYAGYADSAGSCPTATNATTVGGYGVSVGQAASTVVVRSSSGYSFFNYINSDTSNGENPGVSQVIVTNGSDGYYRKASIAHFTAYVQSNASGSWGINITGSANYASSAGGVAWTNVSGRPTALSSFSNDLGNYGGWITSAGSCNYANYAGYIAGSSFCYTTNGLSVGTSSNPYGAGYIVATNDVYAGYSDRRLKKDIKPIANALEKIKQISGITYKNNDIAAEYGYTDTSEQVGVLAQEIQKVLPQVVKPAPFDVDNEDGKVVSKSGENYLTVQYEKIIPLLIEAIKEQQLQIEELKSKVG